MKNKNKLINKVISDEGKIYEENKAGRCDKEGWRALGGESELPG